AAGEWDALIYSPGRVRSFLRKTLCTTAITISPLGGGRESALFHEGPPAKIETGVPFPRTSALTRLISEPTQYKAKHEIVKYCGSGQSGKQAKAPVGCLGHSF